MVQKSQKKHPLASRRRRQLAFVFIVVLSIVVLARRLGYFGPLPAGDHSRYHDRKFTVIKVVDGDTIDIDIPDLQTGKAYTRVRLWGVDTPETKHPDQDAMYYGLEAAEFTRRATLNRQVTIKLEPFQKPRDYYGRLLAYIYLPDGKMLNEQLITQGFGYADHRFDHILRRNFLQLQKNTQREKQGLWQNVRPDQWPLWYRRRHDPDYQQKNLN